MSSDTAYESCCLCGVKIDYGNYLVFNNWIYCGDKKHCPYHHNCKRMIEDFANKIPDNINKNPFWKDNHNFKPENKNTLCVILVNFDNGSAVYPHNVLYWWEGNYWFCADGSYDKIDDKYVVAFLEIFPVEK